MRNIRHIFIGSMALLCLTLALSHATAAPIWTEDFNTPPSGWDYYMTSLNPYVTMDVSGGSLNMYAPYASYNATQGFLISALSDAAVNPPERENVEASTVTQISGEIRDIYSGVVIRGQDINYVTGAPMITGRGYSYNVSGYDSGAHDGAGEAGLYRLDSDGTGADPQVTLEINYLSDAVFANLVDTDIYVKLSAITTHDNNVLLKGMMSYNADFSDPFGEIEYLDDSEGRVLGAGLTGLVGMNNAEDKACSAHWDEFVINEVFIIPGDTDYSGVVDDTDAATLAANWLQSGADWSMGDFNGDEVVDGADASLLAANWQTGTTAAVPEPSMLMLAVGAFLPLVWRRRK